ncbi:MAG: hypothetical protein FWC70_01505 [Defluviitaleaceae bacterium]|nr:hypothetical protein [Defluviitaleaceae bacterium]
MLRYSAKIPIIDTATMSDCTELFIRWVEDSPHRDVTVDYDVTSRDDYTKEFGDKKVSIMHYCDEFCDTAILRLVENDAGVIYTTDCSYFSAGGEKYIKVQLSCNAQTPSSKLPNNKIPRIAEMLMEKNMCKPDRFFPITDAPVFVSEENLAQCAEYMRGESDDCLPMVYVSCKKSGKPALTGDKLTELAKRISGLAHVVVEPNKKIRYRLQELTDSRNVVDGCVGVYYPKSENREKFNPDDADESTIYTAVQRAISNDVRSLEYNWQNVELLRAKKKITEMAKAIEVEKDEKLKILTDSDAFMAAFDAEISEYKEKIDSLNLQLNSAIAEKEGYKVRLQNLGNENLINPGDAEEFFPGEKNDLIYSILEQCLGKIDKGSYPRIYDLLLSLVEANQSFDTGKENFRHIKEILKKGELRPKERNDLQAFGVTFTEKGHGHDKAYFGEPKYGVTISLTPSDRKGAQNNASDFIKPFDIYRKFL